MNSQNSQSKVKIWIDADACPRSIKSIVFKASNRLKIQVILVANSYMFAPLSELIKIEVVPEGPDMADHHIVKHVASNDLVITADIPLAALVVEKGATALNPRGELYTATNVQERLSMRNLMQELRDQGEVTGGPSQFSSRDIQRFSNALDRTLTQTLNK